MSFSLRSASLLVAGLMGLAGVVTAAAASHGSDPRLMAGASAMCLAHAPALIALYAAWPSMRTAPLAAILLIIGTALFAGDLVFRHSTGHGLFPMSAPTGGVVMMAGWLAVALGAFLPRKDA
ncbi:DUF423 domain-containing protein [Shinella zoogloeoides]|uniref:DUF423 domain-containing protein n=1 Tax=Shinella zoogloeoides TaxID=352475 RepID=UPI00273E328C|nr:DUF423 domain-containing protein [Shinella zoogloeoides]WLR91557.1 DUF423 domain-containing protein [Shinella zoogloeoides]